MIVVIPKEIHPLETRTAVTPVTVKQLIKSGLNVRIESGAGQASFISDSDYQDAGAEILDSGSKVLSKLM